MLKNLSTIW